MATTPPDLAKLLTALRAARDPWSRLKLVTAGARQLSRLTARERRELLRKVGLEGAEEIADLAAGGNPEAAEALDATLRWLEGNPQELQQFVREVAEPQSRRATLAGLAAHVLEVITAPAPAPPPPQPAPVATPPAAAAPPASAGVARPAAGSGGPPKDAPSAKGTASAAGRRAPQPAAPAAAAAGAVAATATVAAGAGAHRAAAPPAGAPPPAAPPVVTEVPAGELVATVVPTVERAPAPAGRSVAAPPSWPPPSGPAAPARPPEGRRERRAPAERPAAGDGTRRRDAAPGGGALATLQALREQLASGRPPGREALAAVLQHELAHDWARRKALAALFASGLPAGAEEALALVDTLAEPASRRWALADLAASRRWSDEDFTRLVAAADTPSLRRRLALRRPAR